VGASTGALLGDWQTVRLRMVKSEEQRNELDKAVLWLAAHAR
jgi:hypothetical protein